MTHRPEARIKPTTPRQQERAARILKAARRAFAASSFDQVLMEDVAREAGVGKGTVYRYFPGKENLYFAVIFEGIAALQSQIRAALSAQGDVAGSVRDLIDALVTFFSRNRHFFQLMNVEDHQVGGERSPNRQRWRRERRGLIDAIAALLEHGKETGALAVTRPRTEAQILLGMVRTVLRHRDERLKPGEMADEVARIYLEGVRPRHEESSMVPKRQQRNGN